MTPLQMLYNAALENRRKGHKVITLDFVIDCLEKEQTFYKLEPSKRLSEASNI